MNDFEKLAGRTIAPVEGAEVGSEHIKFYCTDGAVLSLYHYQDCCESVEVSEIIGDIADLIGTPVTMAEVAVSENETPEGTAIGENDYVGESYTWTFYKLATVRGYVTLRWLGSSNGYYSEAVYSEWKGLPQ